MSRKIMGAVLALFSLMALTVGASSAGATGTGPVRVNTSSTVATASPTSLGVVGGPSVTCASMRLPASITSSGAVSIGANAVAFNTCQIAGFISVTITNPAAWSGQIAHLDDAGGNPTAATLDITVPARGVHFSGAGCSFDLSGTALGDFPISAAHGVLVDIPGINFPASLSSGNNLVIANVSGLTCALAGISNGARAGFSGRFSFSPVVNGAAL
jgi:hypothetical protein